MGTSLSRYVMLCDFLTNSSSNAGGFALFHELISEGLLRKATTTLSLPKTGCHATPLMNRTSPFLRLSSKISSPTWMYILISSITHPTILIKFYFTSSKFLWWQIGQGSKRISFQKNLPQPEKITKSAQNFRLQIFAFNFIVYVLE